MYELGLGRAASQSGSSAPTIGQDGRAGQSGGNDTDSDAFDKAFARSGQEPPPRGLKWVKAKLSVAERQKVPEQLPVVTGAKDAFVFSFSDAIPKQEPPATTLDPEPVVEPIQFPPLVANFDGSARETAFPGELAAEGQSGELTQQINAQAQKAAAAGSEAEPRANADLFWTAPKPLATGLEVSAASAEVGTKGAAATTAGEELPTFKSRHVPRGDIIAAPPQGDHLAEQPQLGAQKGAMLASSNQSGFQGDGESGRGWNWFRAAGPASEQAATDAKADGDSQTRGATQSLSNTLAAPSEFQFVSHRGKPQGSPLDLGLTPLEAADTSLRLASTTAMSQPAATQPQVAQQVFAQIMVAVEQAKTNDIEITLDPEDLGKVRIVLSPKEGGYDITVIASREQTLDMMRKFGSDLSASFAALGYGHTDLNFESSGDESGGQERRPTDGQADSQPEHTDMPPQLHVMRGGLDLKL